MWSLRLSLWVWRERGQGGRIWDFRGQSPPFGQRFHSPALRPRWSRRIIGGERRGNGRGRRKGTEAAGKPGRPGQVPGFGEAEGRQQVANGSISLTRAQRINRQKIETKRNTAELAVTVRRNTTGPSEAAQGGGIGGRHSLQKVRLC